MNANGEVDSSFLFLPLDNVSAFKGKFSENNRICKDNIYYLLCSKEKQYLKTQSLLSPFEVEKNEFFNWK